MTDSSIDVKDAAGAIKTLDTSIPTSSTEHRQKVILSDPDTIGGTMPVDATYGGRMQVTGQAMTLVASTIVTSTGTVSATSVGQFGNATIRVSTPAAITASFVFEVSEDGGTTWVIDQVRRERDGQLLNGDTLAASTTEMYTMDLPAVNAVRVRATALTATGPLTVRIGAGGFLGMPAVSLANKTAATAPGTIVRQAVTTATAQIVAANPNRRKITLWNDSAVTVLILLGPGTQTVTNSSFPLGPGGTWESDTWLGRIAGITRSGSGNVNATEETP